MNIEKRTAKGLHLFLGSSKVQKTLFLEVAAVAVGLVVDTVSEEKGNVQMREMVKAMEQINQSSHLQDQRYACRGKHQS
ncbi:MAG: hypothetical protein P4L55_23700 [Syntrophobacteraceae bacterium]|nr:hypothetical protein [Syntrophobacteraceae bacterium]